MTKGKTDSDNPGRTDWTTLFRWSGIVPWAVLACYLLEFGAIILGGEYPDSVLDWFSVFQENVLLGLLYINALDPISIALLGVMYLGIYQTLKTVKPSWSLTGVFFALAGVVIFIIPRMDMLAVISLSGQYAAATSDTQRTVLLAAGQALQAPVLPSPQTPGFSFMAVGVILFSGAMLTGGPFGKWTAYTGLLAGMVTLIDNTVMLFSPAIAGLLMPLSGLLWILWWFMVGRALARLGKPQKLLY